MIGRALLLITIVLITLPSAAVDGFRTDHSDCLEFPAQQGLFTNAIRVVMTASGILESSADVALKSCGPAGVRRISLHRLAAYSDYSPLVAIIHAGKQRNIPVETIKTDTAVQPILGGGPKMQFHYRIPSLLPGDELHESMRASVPPILSGNQFSVQNLQGIQDALAYDVVLESERSDVTAKLVDPGKILSQVLDSPTRKEWRSIGPRPGVRLPTPRLEITTLGNWEKLARQLRAVYFMDSAELENLQAAGIQRAGDAEALFKEFTFRFGAVNVSEYRSDPRPLASILQTKGGDCKSLTFLLINLLRWAGIDAELVLESEGHKLDLTDVFSFGDMDHVLVYVPSLDRYFDPTLAADWQQAQLDRSMRNKNRVHVAGPSDGKVHPPPACADYCLLTGSGRPVGNGRPNGDPVHAVRVRTETIRGYASRHAGSPVHAPSQ